MSFAERGLNYEEGLVLRVEDAAQRILVLGILNAVEVLVNLIQIEVQHEVRERLLHLVYSGALGESLYLGSLLFTVENVQIIIDCRLVVCVEFGQFSGGLIEAFLRNEWFLLGIDPENQSFDAFQGVTEKLENFLVFFVGSFIAVDEDEENHL